MNISVVLKESDAQIEKLILDALIEEINPVLSRAAIQIKKIVKPYFITAIKACPEMVSLRWGDLRGELGVESAESKLDNIVNVLADSIEIEHKKLTKSAGNLRGGFTLSMVYGDYHDILGLDAATQLTEKGQILDWLAWLLTYGDSIIVRDYEVSFNVPPRSKSRTGIAVMMKTEKGRWRVPSQYSGTANDNFITRVLDGMESVITDIMQEEMERAI